MRVGELFHHSSGFALPEANETSLTQIHGRGMVLHRMEDLLLSVYVQKSVHSEGTVNQYKVVSTDCRKDFTEAREAKIAVLMLTCAR